MKLEDRKTRHYFQIELQNQFAPLVLMGIGAETDLDKTSGDTCDINAHWKRTKKLLVDIREKVLGRKEKQWKEWLSDDTY